MGRRLFPGRRAFTLAELLVVIAIVGILALCIMRATKGAIDRADVVRCMGNLRGLHIALVTDVSETDGWPQCPFELGAAGYDEWWIKELSRYKVSEQSWICPTLSRQGQNRFDIGTGKTKLHYIPVTFDNNPFTPRRWARMPWLMEVADMHGEGNLIVFPDGAIIGAARYLSTNP